MKSNHLNQIKILMIILVTNKESRLITIKFENLCQKTLIENYGKTIMNLCLNDIFTMKISSNSLETLQLVLIYQKIQT